MRDISIDIQQSAMPANTFTVYGPTRSGKSHFAATFPRPFIFADVGERGYETVQTMDRSLWFEADVAPIIVGIDQMSDFGKLVEERLKPLIASGRILTVVFDAFTFFCDFILSQITASVPSGDTRQIYGKLGTYLQHVRTTLHQLPVNVVWLCLDAPPETVENGASKMGGPLIPGSQQSKFAAGVNFLFYTRLVQTRKQNEITDERFEIYTRQYGMYSAGNRQGEANALPSPFTGAYRDLLPWLGYDPDVVLSLMKPIKSVVTVPAKPVAKPPITNAAPARTNGTPQRPINTSGPKVTTPTAK